MRERDADAEIGWIKINASSTILDLNEGAAKILRTTREQLIGQQVTLIIPPEYREAHYVAVSRRADGESPRIEGLPLRLPMLRVDGTRTEVEIVLDSSSKPGDAVTTFTATFFEIEQPKKSLWRKFWDWGMALSWV